MSQSGIVPEPLSWQNDERVLEFDIGMTNMVVRGSAGMADLTRAELKEGALALRAKLERYRPKIVCFNGKGIYEIYAGRKASLGIQPKQPGEPWYYVMPSTSARTQSHPRASDKLPYFQQLRALLDRVRGGER